MGKRHNRGTAVQHKPAPVVHTSIQTTPPPAPTIARPVLSKPKGGPALVAYRALTFLASLRLTVVLFALSLLLILFGTLAMMDQGLWGVMRGYFRSGWTWIPWQVFVRFGQTFLDVPQSVHVSGSFPYPGGWLLGTLLLVNLLAAHTVRFKLSWKRSGVLILHSGLIMLMLGELVTGLFAVEARMTLAQGETVGFVEVSHRWMGIPFELAVTDKSGMENDQVTVIPASRLQPGTVIRHESLPFDVEVVEYMKNTDLPSVSSEDPQAADVFQTVDGEKFQVVPCAEGRGVDSEAREDYPAVRVRLLKKGTNEAIGTYLLAVWFNPNSVNRIRIFPEQWATVDGKAYVVAFRPERIYKPYAIHLNEFRHTVYPGTDKPKDYSSLVRLSDPEEGEDRETRVYMNNPLRYNGETFYQIGFLPGDRGTVLQVVRNPGWLMPYFSCALVALGMLVHFGIHLYQFLSRRFAL
jgi:hypothetical protein